MEILWHQIWSSSAAASGWAGWALSHPEFWSSVNPITTRGADYALHITASPPRFENPAASLSSNRKVHGKRKTLTMIPKRMIFTCILASQKPYMKHNEILSGLKMRLLRAKVWIL